MTMMIRASGEKKDEDGDGVDDMMAKVEWTLAREGSHQSRRKVESVPPTTAGSKKGNAVTIAAAL